MFENFFCLRFFRKNHGCELEFAELCRFAELKLELEKQKIPLLELKLEFEKS